MTTTTATTTPKQLLVVFFLLMINYFTTLTLARRESSPPKTIPSSSSMIGAVAATTGATTAASPSTTTTGMPSTESSQLSWRRRFLNTFGFTTARNSDDDVTRTLPLKQTTASPTAAIQLPPRRQWQYRRAMKGTDDNNDKKTTMMKKRMAFTLSSRPLLSSRKQKTKMKTRNKNLSSSTTPSQLSLRLKHQIHLWKYRMYTFLFDSDKIVPANRTLLHILYWLSAWDAVNSVRYNKYVDYPSISNIKPQNYYYLMMSSRDPSSIKDKDGSNNKKTIKIDGKNVLNEVYSTLFYFAQLRPRLQYAVGALLRALQLCTPLQNVIDPSAGVGAVINFCAIFAGVRWIKPLILGWATTKSMWIWLGATKPKGAHIPITLTIMKPTTITTRLPSSSSSSSSSKSYSLGYSSINT